ncbi:MAG TPA: rhodanese-like domain-containing protein [Tepidisphaeraceae bacterium]|jgi:rhodanese-related sulfurtransferase
MPYRRLIFKLLLVASVILNCQNVCDANSNDGNTCGINSTYAAMRLLGKKVNWDDLIKPRYMSSAKGSSLADLTKIIEDHGLYAMPFDELSSATLANISWPVIINVRADIDSPDYNHWVLVQSRPDGRLLLFDAPNKPQEIGPEQLAGRWRGVGLIVSAHPIQLKEVRAMRWAQISQTLMYLIPLIGAACLIKFLMKQSGKITLRQLAGESIGLLVMASAIGLSYQFFSSGGMLGDNGTLQTVMRQKFSSFLTKIDVGQAHQLLSQHVTFVDARLPEDYKSGHIPGALNIPIGMPPESFRAVLTSVRHDSPIVVYCQSTSCPYSDAVAKALAEDGYTNLVLFRPGWMGWEQSQSSSGQDVVARKD